MTLWRMAFGLWVFGTILIVLGWTGHVSARTSWLGFVISLVGGVLTWTSTRAAPPVQASRLGEGTSPADEIAKLAELRARGHITDDEFQSKKKQLLRQIGNDSPGTPFSD